MAIWRPRSAPLALAGLLAGLAAACAAGETPPAPTPAPTLAAAPVVAPTAATVVFPALAPTPAPSLTADGGVALLERAWRTIADYHIDSPDARALLEAGWREAATEARRQGIGGEAAPPAFAAAGDEMWPAFADAYRALVAPARPDNAAAIGSAAIGGMTRSLNDCHTFYLPPARSDALVELRTGSGGVGIGVELAATRPPYVRDLVTGSPADAAGLQLGDRLMAIEGQDVTAMALETINDLLRGPPGSQVALEARRPASGALHSFAITRDFVRPTVADGRVLASGVGYLRIRAFTSGTLVRDAIDEAVRRFEEAGVRAWILDLRDNPGGEADIGLDERFVGSGVVQRTLLRAGGVELREVDGEPYPKRPLAVLVNAASASVAEIFAASLQDHGRARVFGTATAKCAGFVSLELMPDASTLGVTIAHSLTPVTGRPLWRTGVVPDVVVARSPEDLAAGRDPVIDRAVEWLRTQVR